MESNFLIGWYKQLRLYIIYNWNYELYYGKRIVKYVEYTNLFDARKQQRIGYNKNSILIFIFLR